MFVSYDTSNINDPEEAEERSGNYIKIAGANSGNSNEKSHKERKRVCNRL